MVDGSMETLDTIRHRIKTTDDLAAVVRTLKALSAVSLRQYEKAVALLEDYYRTIEMGLHVVFKDNQIAPMAPPPKQAPERAGAVVFGSDQGLCGRLNEDIAQYAVRILDKLGVNPQNRMVLALGSRVQAFLQELNQPVEGCLSIPASVAGITGKVEQILVTIDE